MAAQPTTPTTPTPAPAPLNLRFDVPLNDQWLARITRGDGSHVSTMRGRSSRVSGSVDAVVLRDLEKLEKKASALSRQRPENAVETLQKAAQRIGDSLEGAHHMQRLLQSLSASRSTRTLPALLLFPTLLFRGKPNRGAARWTGDQYVLSFIPGIEEATLTPDLKARRWHFAVVRGEPLSWQFPFVQDWSLGVTQSPLPNHPVRRVGDSDFVIESGSALATFIVFAAATAETLPFVVQLAMAKDKVQLLDQTLGLDLVERLREFENKRETTGARALVRSLHLLGVTVVFGGTSKRVLPLLEAMAIEQDSPRLVSVPSGEIACMAALGHARATGCASVALCTHAEGGGCEASRVAERLCVPLLCVSVTEPQAWGADAAEEGPAAGDQGGSLQHLLTTWKAMVTTCQPRRLRLRFEDLVSAEHYALTPSEARDARAESFASRTIDQETLAALKLVLLRARGPRELEPSESVLLLFGQELLSCGHEALHEAHRLADVLDQSGVRVRIGTLAQGKGAANERHPLALASPITLKTPLRRELWRDVPGGPILIGLGVHASALNLAAGHLSLPDRQFFFRAKNGEVCRWADTLSSAASWVQSTLGRSSAAGPRQRTARHQLHALSATGVAGVAEGGDDHVSFQSSGDVWGPLRPFASHARTICFDVLGAFARGLVAHLQVPCGTVLAGKGVEPLSALLGAECGRTTPERKDEFVGGGAVGGGGGGGGGGGKRDPRLRALAFVDTAGMQRSTAQLSALQRHGVRVTIVLLDDGRHVLSSLFVRDLDVEGGEDRFDDLPTFDFEHMLTLVGGGKRTLPFEQGGQAFARVSSPSQLIRALETFENHPGPALVQCVLPRGSADDDVRELAKAFLNPISEAQ